MKRISSLIFLFFLCLGFIFPQSITVISPAGGEVFRIGDTITAAWNTSGINSGTVRILFRKADGSGGRSAGNFAYNASPQQFTIPDNAEIGAYFVRILWNENTDVRGESSQFFVSHLLIDVTVPRPNAALVAGITYTLKWDLRGHMPGACFNLHLFRGSSPVRDIAANLCSTSVPWTVPELTSADNYFIRVITTDNRALGDSGNFSIKSYKPDLVVSRMDIITNPPGSQHQFIFKGWIENDSLGRAEASKARLTISGPQGYSRVFDNLPVGALNYGADHLVTVSYTLPRSGVYTNTLEADSGSQVGEANEANNSKSKSYRAGGLPDLVVCYYKQVRVLIQVVALSVKNYQSGVEVFVKNIGEERSAPARLRFWIEERGVKYYSVPGLAAGQQHRIFRAEKWHTTGTRKYSVIIDDDKKVLESNEDNNKGEGTIKKSTTYGLLPPLVCSGQPIMQMQIKRR